MASDFKELYSSYVDFINVFLDDEKFFSDFIRVVKDSYNEFSIVNKQHVKTIELDWIEAIEKYLPSIDKVIRNPRKFIENREEVLPIEISRNITVDSIKHLAQHTNLISHIDGDKITPSKILNVFKEESYDTYENRFVNTLINRLYIFLEKRFDKLNDSSLDDNYLSLKMNQEINVNDQEQLCINFEIKANQKSETTRTTSNNVFERVKKLRKIINEYATSPFANEMNKFAFIKPPVMRTNAIMKNTELRDCLNLWLFVESYDKIGYTIDFIDTISKPNDEYINELYSLTAIQYALFKYFTTSPSEDLIIRKVKRKKAAVPKFIKEIYEEFTTEYNISDVEFRKIMDVQRISLNKKKSEHEKKIKLVIDNALKAEKQYKKDLLASQKLNKKKRKLVSWWLWKKHFQKYLHLFYIFW